MYSKKPILITGSHRSGSTWVGKILATSPTVRYIPEPFNINHPQCKCGFNFDLWYQYVCQENESIFYNHLKHTLGLSYNLLGEAKAINTPEFAFEQLTKFSKFMMHRILGIRPLVKDPIAFFSTDWLAAKFNMNVIVLIRHPAAFASSIKRLNWTFPFSHFLEQPLLMKDYLQPFEDEIRRYSAQDQNIIDQAILLWKIIHYCIAFYQKYHRDWIFIRHEDISRDPLSEFKKIFNQLKLDYTEKTIELIKDYSYNFNSSKRIQEVHDLKRDSQANIWSWKTQLTPPEIERIRNICEDISRKFYSDKDW